MKKSYLTVIIVLVILVFVVIGFGVYVFILKNTNSSLGARDAETQIVPKKGWSVYDNKDGMFTINHPSNLIITENKAQIWKSNESGYEGGVKGLISICSKDINPEDEVCRSGLNIYYGVPFMNWFDGCPEDQPTVLVNMLNKQIKACEGDWGVQTREKIFHPDGVSEIRIYAQYDTRFTESEAKEMIKTFSFY